MRIHFCSDLLFGRTKAAELRGFQSTDDMETELIRRWNAAVKPDDLVYHLGNFAWDPISAEAAMANLNGTICFGIAKHDRCIPGTSLVQAGKHMLIKSQISIVQGYLINKVEKRVVMAYWPLMDWPDKKRGVIHTHGGIVPPSAKDSRFSVNCERWNLAPVDLDLLIDIIESEKAETLDRQ